jgi:prepilin-type N-terminal cleavage/methylation domain-containing protein
VTVVSKIRRKGVGGGSRGFSLIELLIVLMVAMCVMAVATPTMLHIVADVRTRSTMSNLSGVVQRCRSEAIRQNKPMTVHFGVTGGEVSAFVHDAADAGTTPSVGDAQIVLGSGVQMFRTPPSGTGAPTELTGTLLWGTSAESAEPDHQHDVTFNSRGLPCYYDMSTTPATCTSKGFVYYFTYQPPFGANGWTAISVSPAGRIKSWMWNGDAWNN